VNLDLYGPPAGVGFAASAKAVRVRALGLTPQSSVAFSPVGIEHPPILSSLDLKPVSESGLVILENLDEVRHR
jgi:hypothetical protein